MKTEFDKALDAVRKLAADKSEQLINELDSAGEALLGAAESYDTAMVEVKRLRDEAAQSASQATLKEQAAARTFIKAVNEGNAICLALVRQLEDGTLDTGKTETVAPGHAGGGGHAE